MPIDGRSVEAASRQFCDNINHLLAKTITERRLITINLGERVQIAFRKSEIVEPAILQTKYGLMELYIGLTCDAVKRKGKARLQIFAYRYSLGVANQDPVWRWEYKRDWPKDSDRWCRHHIQGDLPVSIAGLHALSLNDLHLPTGYVAIEEVIRFCIVDLGVVALYDDWHETLQKSYRQFKLEPHTEFG